MQATHTPKVSWKAMTLGVSTAALLALPAVGFAAKAPAAMPSQIGLGSKQHVTLTLLTPNYYPSTKLHPRVGAPVGQVAISHIIASYEKLHPNVKIIDITPPPWGALTQWVTGHAANNSLPDILENGAGYFTVPEDSSELVNLSPYLRQKNPYNAKAKAWAGTFIPGLLAETNANFLGPQYEIATDWYIIHSLWYNKTLLNRLHLPVPSTVAQLFNDLKVIKAKDHAVIPIEGQSGYFMLPLDGTDFPWYYNVMFPIFKKMSPHGGHSVKPAQLAYAFKNGWLSYQKNPRLKWLVATLFNDFLPYTASRQALLTAEENASSSTSSPTSPFNQFVQGKIAFLPGAGYLTQYFYGANALHPSFQIGVERMPRLTKATTPYANPTQQQSGASVGVPYSVTQEAARQHVVNWAVNFLQYLTSVKNDQYLVNNGFRFIPGIKGAVPSKTALAYKLATAGPVNWGAYPAVVPNPLSDPSAVATNKSYWEYFTLNQLGYPTVAAKVDQNNLAWANQTIAQNHYANPYK